MTEHTPLPWKRSASVIWSEKGKQVVCAVGEPEPKSGHVSYEKLQIGSKRFDTAMDNARLIVCACNSHADLLKALESINSILAVWVLDPGKAPNTLVTSINAIIQPAIEKAKEQPE